MGNHLFFKIMSWESSDFVRFDLGLLFQGQIRIAKLKCAYNSLIIGPRGLGCETTFFKIMSWESSDLVRFNLGLLLQGQMRIAKLTVLITHLLLGLHVWDVKPTNRKSWAGSLLMW